MTAKRVTAVRGAVVLALSGVPLILLLLAIPRFDLGLRIEPEHRLVLSSIVERAIEPAAANRAAIAFAAAPPDDGDDRAQSAEFLTLASPGATVLLEQSRERMREALDHAPANPRAWIALCELERDQDPSETVGCLDTAFGLTQYDWFTTRRRMRLVAAQWPYLDENLRDRAVDVVLPMWNSSKWVNGWTLQYVLYDLSRSANGRQLLLAGFIADHDALRSFNRFVIEERADGR